MFIDRAYVKANCLPTQTLLSPIPIHNVDGTLNKAGSVTEVVELVLRYQNHSERAFFAVTGLGSQKVIMGHSWLLSGDTGFMTQSGYIPDPRPLYTFRPIDVDSRFPNPVQTCPLPDKPVTAERPSGLITFSFYFSYDFLIIRPLYYLLFPLSPYLGL